MPDWKQMVPKPVGSIPAGLMNKLVAGLAVVLVIAIIAATIGGAGEEEDGAEADALDQAPADPFMADRLDSEVENQLQLAVGEADQREADAQREAIRDRNLELLAPDPDPGESVLLRLAGIADDDAEEEPDPWDPEAFAPEEAELRLKLHLEAVERRQRSLLAVPVAYSARKVDDDAGHDNPPPPSPHERLLDTILGTAAAQQSTTGTGPGAAAVPPGGTLDVPLPDSDNLPSYRAPDQVSSPADPRGSHRIYEGSFVEAVLITQLSGDYPSPAVAQVAVPFYSGDRQTTLIPRGSRFIGTVQAVRHQDQTRLAIGFHRLVFPDGRWAALRFQGLNQLGEGALKDQVDRHYLSTFLAAGGVGLLSGLAAAGATVQDQFQLGTARSFSETGIQIMDRFLNRLPTITIRAGHRMRVWFTSDLLIPPPDTGDIQ
ncbi:MAG: hypothetical protein F4210_06320 [Holophagales bacterium]|nr:hypothetical protein [Holophagales bacterium]MYF95110.1 hypothetical protein [Holophagales bacterium]